MQGRFAAIGLALLIAFPSSASQIAASKLSQVADQAAVIVIGTVERVETIEASETLGRRLVAHVRPISFLRGEARTEVFKLPLHVGGLRGFDSELARGDHAVFFLRSLGGGEAKLQTWGSVAVFPPRRFEAK